MFSLERGDNNRPLSGGTYDPLSAVERSAEFEFADSDVTAGNVKLWWKDAEPCRFFKGIPPTLGVVGAVAMPD